MTLDTDQATLWHAVLEAIGYDYMEITDLYRGAGVDMSRITITEGGSRSEIWNQMKSDMLGSEVITLKNAGGAVVTDWGDMDIVVDGADAVAAGNDIVMPGGPPVIRQILKGYEEGRVTREEMETAAGHLLCMIRRIHGKEK